MTRQSLLFTIIFLSVFAWINLTSADSCSEDWVCLRPVDLADGSTDFMAENLREVPVTLSLRVRSRNLYSDNENPITVVLPPGRTSLVTRMKKRVPGKSAWYRYNYDWTVGDLNAVHNDEIIYRLPYQSGKRYGVLQGYGSRFSHTGLEHYTIDFNMPVGTPVHAARGGLVARVVEKNDKGCWDDECIAHANYVVILHDDGTTGEYYHLKKNGALVDEGERVSQGQLIALSGNTGHTTMPHLHFGVYRASSWGATQS
ncbi:MAG: M23 family metallopeptidase, partial [Gammaproteobacteria bacterium]|nr:M23 family metallopeptidase [Gammaproteobacteria bacterium]